MFVYSTEFLLILPNCSSSTPVTLGQPEGTSRYDAFDCSKSSTVTRFASCFASMARFSKACLISGETFFSSNTVPSPFVPFIPRSPLSPFRLSCRLCQHLPFRLSCRLCQHLPFHLSEHGTRPSCPSLPMVFFCSKIVFCYKHRVVVVATLGFCKHVISLLVRLA